VKKTFLFFLSLNIIRGGGGVAGAMNGIRIYANHVTCRDVRLEDFYYYGISVERAYAVIDRCTALNCGDDGFAFTVSGHSSLITNSYSSGHSGVASINSGIEIEDGSHHINIIGNTLDMPGNMAIEIHSHTDQPSCHHIVVTNNLVLAGNVGTQLSTGINQHHITIQGNTIKDGFIYIRSWLDSSIVGNVIEHTSSHALVGYTSGVGLSRSIVVNNVFTSATGMGMYLQKANEVLIAGNRISASSKGIQFAPQDNNQIGNVTISGNIFVAGSTAISMYNPSSYAIGEIRLLGNDFSGCTTAISGTISGLIKDNKGYATENSGTATITSGNTYVDVTHGLDIQPATSTISVTPLEDLGNASNYWISDVGSSTFRINVNADPGKDVDFAWQIGSY